MRSPSELLARFEGPRPPFSFRLDNEPARLEFLRKRDKRRKTGETDFVYAVAGAPITVVAETRLNAQRQMLTFRIRLIAEQTVKRRISQVRILEMSDSDATTLRGWEGGFAPARDEKGRKWRTIPVPPLLFKIWDKDLAQDPFSRVSLDGRSSVDLLPIWFLYGQAGGWWIGPEWSGSWSAEAGSDASGGWFRFSLVCLDFEMLQNEEIQLPPVTLGTYEGSIGDGCVNLRRIIRDEIAPGLGEEKPLPPVSAHAIGGDIPELSGEGFRQAADRYAAMGIEQFVIASGWYRPPGGYPSRFSDEEVLQMHPNVKNPKYYQHTSWWEQCGDYEPHPERYPGGIRAYVDYIERRGMVLGLWYDPRLNVFTRTEKLWKDATTPYFHKDPADPTWDMGLIDMGRVSGRELMFELMERFVVEFGAKHLWHDLNVETRPRYWNHTEEEGRKGLKELFHYNGQDEVYDRFREKYPHVWIKWCGSGGSMLNLGIFRRVHSFRTADFGGVADGDHPNADALRDKRTALNWIVPTTYITNLIKLPPAKPGEEDASRLHLLLNVFGSTCTFHHTVRYYSDRDRADITALVGIYKNLRKYLTGDYWSLFPAPVDQTGWDGWQYHDPDTGSGILLFFKRRDSEGETCNDTRLRWPENPADLRFSNIVGEAAVTVAADGGIHIEMPSKAALVRYERGIPAGLDIDNLPA